MATTRRVPARGRARSLVVASLLVVCGAASAACSSNDGESGSADRDEPRPEAVPVVDAAATEGVPAATLDDWVSYGDAVVIVTVRSEEAGAVQGPAAPTEGYRPRMVTVDLEGVEWQHPALSSSLPESFSYGTAGWVVHNGTDAPMRYEGTVRVEVGGRYLMPVAMNAEGDLTPIAPSAVLALDGDEVAVPDDEASPTAAEAALADDTLTQVRAELSAAVPDPLAEQNRHLEPMARAQAVAAAG